MTATPTAGQRFLDDRGVHWLVQTVTRSDHLDGFYIVRLAFGDDARCETDVWVLGRREYEALVRERKLVPVNPVARVRKCDLRDS